MYIRPGITSWASSFCVNRCAGDQSDGTSIWSCFHYVKTPVPKGITGRRPLCGNLNQSRKVLLIGGPLKGPGKNPSETPRIRLGDRGPQAMRDWVGST